MSRIPCIGVCGPTAVGKSKLAIELALALQSRFKGAQVINADALQVYAALPTLTAKVSEAEMKGVPHRLMSFLDPLQDDEYHMLDFKRDAHQAIKDIAAVGQVPIVTGGTAYYVQHLFCPPEPLKQQADQVDLSSLSPDQRHLLGLLDTLPAISTSAEFPPGFPIDQLPPDQRDPSVLAHSLWGLLHTLAPDRASKWHWKDVRKVRRHIELLFETPRTDAGAQTDSQVQPDYDVLLFWLHCERDVLIERLNARVDRMVEEGLVEEVQHLYQGQRAQGRPIDYSKGIGQAIGYRPVSEWLATPDRTQQGLRDAVERTKIQTRQFAKKQTSWFKQKLWPAVRSAQGVRLFVLDTTDLAAFDDQVVHAACEIAQAFLSQQPLPDPASVCSIAADMVPAADEKDAAPLVQIQCDICTKDPSRPFLVLSGDAHAKHLASKSHRARQRRQSQFGPSQKHNVAKECTG